MLSYKFKATVAAIVVAAGVAATVAPAEAQYRRHYRGDRGAAVGAGIALGIIGLGAAAIAADQRRQAYESYYGPRYGYYGGPAYYEEAPPAVVYRRNRHADDRYPHTFYRREYID
jgi:hypothetical protein